MNNNSLQTSEKQFKILNINSFIAYIIIGIWGLIIAGIMISKVKSVSYIDDDCIKYNFYNQCIEYK